MRRNRKRNTHHANLTSHVTGGVALLVMISVTMLFMWFFDSKCSQLGQEIGRHERTLKKLEDERVRAENSWNECRTPARLQEALTRHGLKMALPTADQIVRMDRRGVLYPNQVNVARLIRAQHSAQAVAVR